MKGDASGRYYPRCMVVRVAGVSRRSQLQISRRSMAIEDLDRAVSYARVAPPVRGGIIPRRQACPEHHSMSSVFSIPPPRNFPKS
jgi:hypothetical protein